PQSIIAQQPELVPEKKETTGISTADFDNVHVIEWAPANTPFNILYNFAYLTGSGNLTFSQSTLPGADQWITIPNKEHPLPTP
ncbi:MAG: hypothetical protein ABI986_02560, partial [Chloroflexota bacterium]